MANGPAETLARAIHERWRVEQRAVGKPAPSWSELDDSRRDSSRSQARDIAAKLHSIGCAITPLSDHSESAFTFTEQEEESLAIAEHDRRVKERRKSGWTLGDREPERKKTPYLVPFADLPPDIADYDRLFVGGDPRPARICRPAGRPGEPRLSAAGMATPHLRATRADPRSRQLPIS